MPQFLKLQPPFLALENFLNTIPTREPQVEVLPVYQAFGRVLAEDIHAPHPLPEFPRSTVDGYAVQSPDTHGASESLPAYLQLIGEVPMGAAPQFEVGKGQAALIHTGGMIPHGADAVVMLEQSEVIHEKEVAFSKAVSHNENVIVAGEDVKTGDLVLTRGKTLREPRFARACGRTWPRAAFPL